MLQHIKSFLTGLKDVPTVPLRYDLRELAHISVYEINPPMDVRIFMSLVASGLIYLAFGVVVLLEQFRTNTDISTTEIDTVSDTEPDLDS